MHLNRTTTENNPSALPRLVQVTITNQISTESPPSSEIPETCNYYINNVPMFIHVLLATALINAKDSYGNIYRVRAFLDQGSQASFVTERTVNLLRFKKTSTNIPITGLGSSKAAVVRSKVILTLSSIYNKDFTFNVNALTLSKITNLLPSQQFKLGDWKHLAKLELADPSYNEPTEIDILLGAEIYGWNNQRFTRCIHCRTLHQLANDDGHKFPLAKLVLLNDLAKMQ